jgi:hypothetical protein
MIQHYVGEITEKRHCRMVSHSDVYTPAGRTKIQVIWDLSVKPIDDQHCEYTNSVRGLATPEFLTFIAEHGITFEQAAAARLRRPQQPRDAVVRQEHRAQGARP